MIESAEDFLIKLKKAKLKMKNVCDKSGVTEATASLWINGKRGTRITTIARLVKAYEELRKPK